MYLLNFHFPNSHATHTKDNLFLRYTVSYLTTCELHMLDSHVVRDLLHAVSTRNTFSNFKLPHSQLPH